MILSPISIWTVIYSACATRVLAQILPYNPTFLLEGLDSKIYQFSASSSSQFAVYDVAKSINASSSPSTITTVLPFLSNSSNSFVPVAVDDGIQVFSGECSLKTQELSLWSYNYSSGNHSWTQMQTSSTNPSISANFLSAAFAFPSSGDQINDTLYIFGGMCPSANESAESWTTDATYSNTMLTITMEAANDYEVSLTGQRAPPVAEAGLSITPLTSSSVGSSLQQNFVLVGGHTQAAFIDMSQVAMFSLPEQAWAFINVHQPVGNPIEPRSGHTAVISHDGSQIFVFGGWVGNVTNPALPQLAILQVGQGYGGNGTWAWTVPQQSSGPLSSGNGIYGHGAIMLPGDVMMVTGGYTTSSTNSKAKRDLSELMFYNTSSATWVSSYTNPQDTAEVLSSPNSFGRSQKAGLGLGLGLGTAILIIALVIGSIYFRRKRQARLARERALREMALGTDYGGSVRAESRATNFDMRSVSWGARQEQTIETVGPKQPWFSMNAGKSAVQTTSPPETSRVIDRSGAMLDIPSPTRGLRKNMYSRGAPVFGLQQIPMPSISRIEEEDEERSLKGSVKRVRTSTDGSDRRASDPFKDPLKDPLMVLPSDEAAEQRKHEVQKWVEDWTSAAQSMNMSRSPSKANSRTYSTLSANYTSSSSEKSDRTGSNLSERSNRSNLSIQKSVTGTVSRNASQRSASAGYALFANASMAMSRMAGRPQDSNQAPYNAPPSALDRAASKASKRSISTGDLTELAARKRSNSIEQNNPLPSPRNNAFTSYEDDATVEYWTPPESPIKDYKRNRGRSSSLTNSSKKALGALSQVTRRVLTGTSHVSVADKVSDIEVRSGNSSPTKHTVIPDIGETSPQRAASTSATFWQHRQGAKDWDSLDPQGESSRNLRRRSGRGAYGDDYQGEGPRDEEDEDWDVEQAVQQRVVQVMFTVPKEKLRVVNADTLSLVSRSDTNVSKGSRKSVEGIIEEVSEEAEGQHFQVESGKSAKPVSDAARDGSNSVSRTVEDAGWKGKERLVQKQSSGDTIGTIGKAL